MASVVSDIGSGSLIQIINRGLSRTTNVPPLESTSVIRASGLPRMCMRMEVLRALYGLVSKDEIDSDLRLIFDHGHGLHHSLQNLILPMCGDVLLGMWRCRMCGTIHRGDGAYQNDALLPDTSWRDQIRLKPGVCLTCDAVSDEDEGDGVFMFEELSFFDPDMGMSGHSDGILKVDGMEGYGLLEAKSIGGNIWKVRNAPMFDHVIQSHCYMMFTKLKWTIILYWHKGTNGIDGLKEHIVPFDEEVASNIRKGISQLRKGLRRVEDFLKDNPESDEDGKVNFLSDLHSSSLLPSRICAEDTCKRALTCPAVSSCFKSSSEVPE